MRLAVLYTLLAVVAIYRGHYAVLVSILVGTGVGLLLKYVLDKRYIFRFKAKDLGHDSQVFLLYTLMGLVTTMIFWGVEYGFYAWFGTAEMRYLGGVAGLAIGYLAKYHCDKRFVFVAGIAA
jgi:putative flippase GtrA